MHKFALTTKEAIYYVVMGALAFKGLLLPDTIGLVHEADSTLRDKENLYDARTYRVCRENSFPLAHLDLLAKSICDK